MDLIDKWQSVHRGSLHEEASWSQINEVSLTYVPTGAGFTGHTQLTRFQGLFPSSQHPLSTDQAKRFNNDYHIISCSCDEGRKLVTEEIIISALHNTRLDYMIPGVEATNITYTLSMVVVAQYADDGLLAQVRVYWDQATILRQLGVFHLALHNLIHAVGKVTTFDNELDQVPIVDGMRIAQRLLRPNLQNANPLMSLETLEAVKLNEKRATKPFTKLSPSIKSHKLDDV